MQAEDIFTFRDVPAVFSEVCSGHKTTSVTLNPEQQRQVHKASDTSPFLFLRKTGPE